MDRRRSLYQDVSNYCNHFNTTLKLPVSSIAALSVAALGHRHAPGIHTLPVTTRIVTKGKTTISLLLTYLERQLKDVGDAIDQSGRLSGKEEGLCQVLRIGTLNGLMAKGRLRCDG